MVDEFSSFARMRKPAKSRGDLRETVRDAAFMQSVANPEIEVTADVPDAPVHAVYDARLVGQALTNVVKNATEAVSARSGDDLPKGRVKVQLRGEVNEGSGRIVIDVIDNGIGLPEEKQKPAARTLHDHAGKKGTGLGLAIVRKILEDHGGRDRIARRPPKSTPEDTGTLVRLALAANAESEPETEDQDQAVIAHGV
ncbi:ATP-binding protein [Roseibium salinum]|nr:ATP-binding protein [Roseibium salinum]